MGKKIFILSFLVLLFQVGYTQFAYRIKADILTKTRLPDSTFQISKGQIHYDQNFKKIIFDFTFPEKEKVVIFDTLMYSYWSDQSVQKSKSLLIPEQSFFQFILNDNLTNYGFDQSNFKATETKRSKDLVITTWIPPVGLKKYISKILVATKQKKLYAVTILNHEEKVISRQILKNYMLINDLDIPHEVLVATYLEKSTIYQIITLKNVEINESGNNQQYNYDL